MNMKKSRTANEPGTKLPYRGFLLDSARHMQSLDEIKKLIDTLSVLGFNKFHWHLTDDQGWRFSSDVFPSLNTVAAFRPYSDFGRMCRNEPYGGVYTKDEMREIVSHCAGRGIDVVPEFDVPGHTSALLSAFPELSCSGLPVKIKTHQGIFKDVLCPANEKTFSVVFALLDEFFDVFPGKFIHIGGDETPAVHWKNCPDCRKYMHDHGIETFAEYHADFMNRVIDFTESRGRHCIVWNDAVKGGNLDKRAVVQYWKEGDKATVRFLNEGGKGILSPFSYFYLDYDCDITPLNRVFSMKPELPGLTPDGKRNIIGMEATLWTEYINDDRALEEHAFPRAIAVAKAATGENVMTYEEFLSEVRMLRNELGVSFSDESSWTRPRAAMLIGWLRFVKEHYSKAFIKEQLFQ